MAAAAGGVYVLSGNITTDPKHCSSLGASLLMQDLTKFTSTVTATLAEEVQNTMQVIPMEENIRQPCYIYCRSTVCQITCSFMVIQKRPHHLQCHSHSTEDSDTYMLAMAQ